MSLQAERSAIIVCENRIDWVLSLLARTWFFIVKSLFLFVPTFLVLYIVGTVLLTALYGLLTGIPLLLFSRDLADIPIIYYAFLTGLRLAIIVSFLVWIFATLFAAIGNKTKSFFAWFVFFVIFGGLIGGLSGMVVVLALGSEIDASEITRQEALYIVVSYVGCFAGVVAFASALLSPLWFFAYHESLSLSEYIGCDCSK